MPKPTLTISGKFNASGFVVVTGGGSILHAEEFAEPKPAIEARLACQTRTDELTQERRAVFGGVTFSGKLKFERKG